MSLYNHRAEEASVFSTPPDDTSLVLAAKSGEHSALIELFERHAAKVRRTAHRITKNPHDTEDAMQDAFLSAYSHICQFDGRAQFSSWLIRITINSSLSILRKRRKRLETSIDSMPHVDSPPAWDLSDPRADIERHYLLQERATILGNAIENLRPSLRDVLKIQQANGRSLRETAEATGLSLAATKSKLVRARQALRRSLHDSPEWCANRRLRKGSGPGENRPFLCEQARS